MSAFAFNRQLVFRSFLLYEPGGKLSISRIPPGYSVFAGINIHSYQHGRGRGRGGASFPSPRHGPGSRSRPGPGPWAAAERLPFAVARLPTSPASHSLPCPKPGKECCNPLHRAFPRNLFSLILHWFGFFIISVTESEETTSEVSDYFRTTRLLNVWALNRACPYLPGTQLTRQKRYDQETGRIWGCTRK